VKCHVPSTRVRLDSNSLGSYVDGIVAQISAKSVLKTSMSMIRGRSSGCRGAGG
jgi:hypothetical protein